MNVLSSVVGSIRRCSEMISSSMVSVFCMGCVAEGVSCGW